MFTLIMMSIFGLTIFSTSATYAVCPDDIVLYLKLDETTAGTYTDFINGTNGIGDDDPTPAASPIGGAQDFDGATNGIDVPADDSFNWLANESFSIEFWINTTTTGSLAGNTAVAVGRNDAFLGGTTDAFWFTGVNNSGFAIFQLNDSSGSNIVEGSLAGGGIRIDDGAWHHVVAVRDESIDTNLIYVDGVLQDSDIIDYTGNGFLSSLAPLNIGELDLLNPGDFNVDGLLDEIALYDRALPLSEIQQHFTNGQSGIDYCEGDAAPASVSAAPFPDDTISIWKLDELAGSTYADAFNGNDGTGDDDPTAAASPIGGAQDFDGATNGIDVPADDSFNWLANESFSIEFWINTTTTGSLAGNTAVAVGRNDAFLGGTTDAFWFTGVNNSGFAIFQLNDSSGSNIVEGSLAGGGIRIDDGAWHHVVAVRDESIDTNLIYVDGVLQDSDIIDYTGNGFLSSLAPLNIGELDLLNPGDFNVDGLLDEIALYDRALPLSEIQTHFNAGAAGNGVETLRPAPTAEAGPAQSNVKGTTTVTLDGSGSTIGYAGTTISTYLWEEVTASGVTITNDTATPTATFTAPDVTQTLTFRLTVTADDGQQSTPDTVDIGIVARVAPVADAGTAQNVTEGDTVTLDGSGSSDADGTIATYLWEQVTGTAVTLTPSVASATPTATFTAPAAGQTLTFKLTVTDDDGLTDDETVDVTVGSAGATLQADAGADQTVAPGASVTLDGSASTGTSPTFAWVQTAGTPVQLAGDDTATPTFTAPTAADISAAVLDTLTFELTVTDNTGTSTDSVDVIVDDSVGSGGGGGGGGCFIGTIF